jgi:hypothetical protein
MYILSETEDTYNVSPALTACISSGYEIGLTFESCLIIIPIAKQISIKHEIKKGDMFLINQSFDQNNYLVCLVGYTSLVVTR